MSFLSAISSLAAELDLFVTDYNEDPTTEQKPMLEQPLVYAKPQAVTLRDADGKTVTILSPLGVSIRTGPKGNLREAKLFAAPGEYEPFSFLLRPKQTLDEVSVSAGDLKGPANEIIPAANIRVASVEGFHGGARDILMPVGRPWSMSAYSTEFFWCTVKVPPKAPPGVYLGQVVVRAGTQPVGSIQISLEVLPIDLAEPPLSLGFNYSKPDDDKDGKILAAHFADMREHGMTCVAPLYDFHLPVYDTDTGDFGAVLEAYKKAGFPGTFYWAAPMGLHVSELAGYGDETNRRWQQKYIKVMRLMHEEAVKHGVPCVFSIGDELTNKGTDGVKTAGRLARFVWEELPEIATTSDMNGYREVMAMAPFLNVATFNNGWDGADHHNQGRRLLNKDFLQEVQAAGAIPWFVNAGSGRFPFGFFFWKMSKFGAKGKVEWYYNLRNERGSLVRTQKDAIYPTLDYERCREGIDDLKYLCKLESLVAKAKPALPETAKARALLDAIDQGIAEDWSVYEGKRGLRFPDDGFAKLDPEKAANFGRLNALRLEIANHIIALQRALNPKD
ncbi:MAG TPA: glycoside hydrolase domain-containing protein [Verrucomicrobiae bacterium]